MFKKIIIDGRYAGQEEVFEAPAILTEAEVAAANAEAEATAQPQVEEQKDAEELDSGSDEEQGGASSSLESASWDEDTGGEAGEGGTN